MCTQLSPIFYNLFVLLLILLPQLRSQQRDRVGEQHLIANTSAAPKRKTMVGRNNQQRGGGGATGINTVRLLWFMFLNPNLTLFVLLFLDKDAGEGEAPAAT